MLPQFDVSAEEKTLAEYNSYVNDVKKQLPTASLDSFVSWTSDIENRILPSLDSMPEKLNEPPNYRAASLVVCLINNE